MGNRPDIHSLQNNREAIWRLWTKSDGTNKPIVKGTRTFGMFCTIDNEISGCRTTRQPDILLAKFTLHSLDSIHLFRVNM